LDLLAAIPAIFVVLIYSVIKGVYVVYPLLLGLAVFLVLAWRRGHAPGKLLRMIGHGVAGSLQLDLILFLIGAAIALWMAAGTVPFLIYYGVRLIYPPLFIVSVFIITLLIALLMGTSTGAIGTIGLVFMMVARAGHIDTNLAAGAIIAAAYLGERTSPVSSTANLIAVVTNTKVHGNLRRLLKPTMWPLVATVSLYTLLSLQNPLHVDFHTTGNALARAFHLSPVVLLPLMIMLVFIMLKVDIRVTLTATVVSALGVAAK